MVHRMLGGHQGPWPEGPDEGLYDARVGAASYAPIVGAFGALAVTAIVVVFTVASDASRVLIALATGLLVVGVFGSVMGSFGLAAIGAERDRTANIVPSIMFIAIPVAISIIAILGAFEVLARIYAPDAVPLFAFITGVGGVFAIWLNALGIGDATGFHPTTMTPQELDEWRGRQWLKSRRDAYRAANIIGGISVVPAIVGTVIRMSGVNVGLSQTEVNVIVGSAIGLTVVGTFLGLNRTKHPETGNDQQSLRCWEAWATPLAIGIYVLFLMIALP